MRFLIRHGVILALLLFAWGRVASAQSSYDTIASIVITNIGPQVASDALIRANVHVKPGERYIRSSVDQDVLNLYSTGFFQNIRVTDQRTDHGVILTYILQGKYRLRGIDFEGNTKYSTAKLLKKISSKVGEPVDERKLFNDSQTIEQMYEKAGYQRTTVKYVLEKVDNQTGQESVLFQVQETPKVKIEEVDFIGAHAFTQHKLRWTIKTRRHWMWSWLTRKGFFKKDQFQDDQETLTDFYRNKGYIDFEIKEVKFINPTPKTMRIEIYVNEGNLYKVGSVAFKGNQLFTTDQIIAGLKRAHVESHSKTNIGVHGLEADVGLTFTPDALSHDIRAVEDFYGGKGYIKVNQGTGNLIVKRIPNTEAGTMDLEYDIQEGDKVYIEKILIKGNVKTKDKVIRRELAVSPGDVFDMVRVRRSKERLEGLGFFERVDTKAAPTETDVPNREDLIVGVDEKSTGQFTFGAGFNSIESLFGYVEVSQANFDLFNPPYFTGGGQKFRLRVQLGLELQDYEVSFIEPWFLNRKLRLGVDLYRSVANYVSLNNLYDVTRTGAKVSLTRALGSEFLIGGISYTLEDIGIVHVNTNAPTTILNTQGDSLVSRFGGSLAYDTRNSYELANKGQRTALTGQLSVGDRDYYRLDVSTDWFFRGFAHNHVLEVSARAGVTASLNSQDVPFYDRYYMGGQDSLRGFDYRGVGPREVTQDGSLFEPIGGDTSWFASAEYTIPIIDRLSFAIFYDIGNVSASPWSLSGTDVIGRRFLLPGQTQPPGFPSTFYGPFVAGNTGRYSDDYGIGLRLLIPYLGPLRLDYGIPIHRDSFNGPSGKFQFGAGFTRPF
jgi:outer membrane protein insertion porin family